MNQLKVFILGFRPYAGASVEEFPAIAYTAAEAKERFREAATAFGGVAPECWVISEEVAGEPEYIPAAASGCPRGWDCV